MPVDLKPIKDYIGLWQLISYNRVERGSADPEFTPPTLIDMAINPVPKFGARSVNVTHTYMDQNNKTIRSDYGFMPVKNSTKRDPRIHIGYLTTSSGGYSMMEQGFVRGNKIYFHLKQFLRRTFGVGPDKNDLDVMELERQYELQDDRKMTLRLRAETNYGIEGFTAEYSKVMP
uniref:DUF1794 domain-containing protein n=1 Tax=Syphacia muris TaxID=451379 RepID=A0A0N5A953_9BILA